MANKIAVLGAGSWGSVLASLLDENGAEVKLWSYNPQQVKEFNQTHTNPRYIKNFTFSTSIVAYSDLKEAIQGVDYLLFVVPTQVTRSVAKQVAQILESNQQKVGIIHASKGLEENTYSRISEILAQEIKPANRKFIAVLSGPSQAEDVVLRDLTLVTVACSSMQDAQIVQKMFMNNYFRPYTSNDVIGVEIGAALKNIIALGAGALSGLGYHDNAKAALMTRGLAEISRLGTSFGANPLTFIGLSGVGDIIVTGTSSNSRNWRAGNELGHGKSLKEVIDTMGMVIEGVPTTKAAYELAKQRGVDMPITSAIYHVLYDNADVKETINALMTREGKPEIE